MAENFEDKHSLLRRQINKASKKGSLYVPLLIDLVNQAYEDADKERLLTDRSISLMSKELLQRQKELIITARRAGMSEVAINVLHNVGNILNSVNISIDIIGETLRKSKIEKLKKIGDLLTEHLDNMVPFLTETDQGKLLINYLIKIFNVLTSEREGLFSELSQLSKNVDHIKSVIVVQQSISGVVGMVEPVLITKILDEVLDLNLSELKNDKIEIEKEYDNVKVINIDRIKLEQVFVNIIQNARDALRSGVNSNKKMTLLVKNISDDKINIQIIDNGVGIPDDLMKNIFSFGFTTKKTGHGFGLHASAIAIKELGGSISVTSEGMNKGANFSIELPTNSSVGQSSKEN